MISTPTSQAPCKLFNKRRAITCYKLKWNPGSLKFDHYELFRITNETPGEFYVLPIETLQKKSKRHISYHKSGAFHWREDDGARVKPVEGEADDRRVRLTGQAMDHLFGQLHGYCIARGRDVSDTSLDKMLEIMDGYIVPPLKVLAVPKALREQKSYTIPLLISPWRLLAEQVIQQANREKPVTIISREAANAKIRETFPQTRITELEPLKSNVAVFSKEATMRLLEVATSMVREKMDPKPTSFWTKPSGIMPPGADNHP